MKKFKIAFVVNHFPSVSETFILNQITDLVERGHAVKIFSFNKGRQNFHKAIERYELIEKTTYFKYTRWTGNRKLLWFLFFILKNFGALTRDLGFKILKPKSLSKTIYDHSLSLSLEKFLKSENFEIVHAHFGQRGAVVANLIDCGKIRQLKFVTSFHGYDLNPLYINRYKDEYKKIFRFADAVTVNSKYLESILTHVCPNPKRLTLLHEGVRTEQYRKIASHEVGKVSSNFNILFCGRLVEFKAPDLAVRIIDILVNKRGFGDLKFRIIGDGKLRSNVEQLINAFRLKDHVFLLGALSQEGVIQEMNKADLFLLPGIHEKETGRAETQGLVVQEAQALEIPVVVSDAGGIKYGLLDGVSGFVVRQGDIEAFADKIELFIKDKELGKKMGKAGRTFVMNNFDTKILGDKLLQLYSSITR